jgi:hypothetical protein
VAGDDPARAVFTPRPARPSWLRVPLTFADRDVVVTFRTPRTPTMQQNQDQE